MPFSTNNLANGLVSYCINSW